jgi:hypothetical protein
MKYLKLFEDTLLNYEAWGKQIYVGIDNDENGGFIKLKVGDKYDKIYLRTKEELNKMKNKL